MPTKVYCEHGAVTKAIRQLQRDGVVELCHFPYDPDSRSSALSVASPSQAQIRDLNLTIAELPGTWADYSGSEHLERIKSTIGREHRRDALHVDSAIKTGCAAFITADTDILNRRAELETFLPIRFFHPERDLSELRALIGQSRAE